MLRRPLLLWIVGLGLLLSPLYYYLERVLLGGARWSEPLAVLGGIPALKLGAAVLGPPVGLLLLMVHRLGWYAIVGYVVYTMGANALLFAEGSIRPSLLALFLPTGLVAIAYLVRREIVSPFFNPRLRGWETDRVRYRARAEIDVPGLPKIEGHSWDVSPSGVYLEIDGTIDPGTRFSLTLHPEPEAEAPLTLSAEAVWSSEGVAGERPRGVGARFDEADAKRVSTALARVLRRASPRLPFKLKVDIAGRESVASETFDLSRDGCYLVTDQRFAVGERLDLTLHLDGPLEIEGTVVRLASDPHGIGVRFSRSPMRLRAALRDFHARRAEA